MSAHMRACTGASVNTSLLQCACVHVHARMPVPRVTLQYCVFISLSLSLLHLRVSTERPCGHASLIAVQ